MVRTSFAGPVTGRTCTNDDLSFEASPPIRVTFHQVNLRRLPNVIRSISKILQQNRNFWNWNILMFHRADFILWPFRPLQMKAMHVFMPLRRPGPPMTLLNEQG